jgi:(2Fe-2S) ferredoxin
MSHKTPFSLTGQFLKFVYGKRKHPKALWISSAGEILKIKLAKPLRYHDYDGWQAGHWVQVWGQQSYRAPKPLEPPQLRLKAYRMQRSHPPVQGDQAPTSDHASSVVPGRPRCDRTLASTALEPTRSSPGPAVIRFCQKSGCMKRGGKAVCQALQSALEHLELGDRVKIEGTGCMKACKAGPNLVVMPDKTHYRNIQAREIPALMQKHFADSLRPAGV